MLETLKKILKQEEKDKKELEDGILELMNDYDESIKNMKKEDTKNDD